MKKTIIAVAIVFLLIIFAFLLVVLKGNEDGWICQDGQWVKHGNPKDAMPVGLCGSPAEVQENMKPAGEESGIQEPIGGQKDDHGCLIGAGYSWCEQKNKCLRVWEEGCPEKANRDTSDKPNQTGIIEGSLGYPSESIPDAMKVCAENVKTKEITCTAEQIRNRKYSSGVGYKLKVPAGTYQIFASLTDPNGLGSSYAPDYRAYYSDFVTCGLVYGCPSHNPINVTVSEGQTISKIDPVDWYKN